jgi:hypothetical protein
MWRRLQRGAFHEVAQTGRRLHADDPADPQPLVLWAAAALANRKPVSARTALEALLRTPADEETLSWARANLAAVEQGTAE